MICALRLLSVLKLNRKVTDDEVFFFLMTVGWAAFLNVLTLREVLITPTSQNQFLNVLAGAPNLPIPQREGSNFLLLGAPLFQGLS